MFYVKYVTYNDKIDEVRMELGSPEQYQIIQPIEVIPTVEEIPKHYEILFKVVDNNSANIISHRMTREELSDYVSVLKHILTQTK